MTILIAIDCIYKKTEIYNGYSVIASFIGDNILVKSNSHNVVSTCKLFIRAVAKQEQPTLGENPRQYLAIHGFVRAQDGVR